MPKQISTSVAVHGIKNDWRQSDWAQLFILAGQNKILFICSALMLLVLKRLGHESVGQSAET